MNEQTDIEIIRKLLREGKKLEAVKYVKDYSNMGLQESKDFVESIEYGNFNEQNSSSESITYPLDFEKVIEYIKKGDALIAVKYVRDTSNLGLKESKELVDIFIENPTLSNENLDRVMQFGDNVNKKQSGSISRSGNKFRATYTNNFGETKNITPADSEWQDFKIMMGNNELLKEYESEFPGRESQSKKSTLFVEEKASSKWVKIIFFFIAFAIAYYFFSRF